MWSHLCPVQSALDSTKCFDVAWELLLQYLEGVLDEHQDFIYSVTERMRLLHVCNHALQYSPKIIANAFIWYGLIVHFISRFDNMYLSIYILKGLIAFVALFFSTAVPAAASNRSACLPLADRSTGLVWVISANCLIFLSNSNLVASFGAEQAFRQFLPLRNKFATTCVSLASHSLPLPL